MDSLTQITLGAAVGEIVLGRKVGNRAMLWGAIGGTLPDLDVIGNLTTDQLGALAFHRAISHSFTFAIVGPLVMGWMVYHIYRQREGVSWWRDLLLSWLAVAGLMTVGAFVLPIPPGEAVATGMATAALMLLPPMVAGLWQQWRPPAVAKPNASWREWSWLLFWAIFTHPLLDCCTSYGTQIFQPFSDYRAALDNISVVDPLYTLPFLTFVLLAARLTRDHPRRRLYNYLGIGISSAYMLFTLGNKYYVNHVFENSLREQGIAYRRVATMPTLANNVLWQGVAESDSVYYFGSYSLLDSDRRIDFHTIAKNHHLLRGYENDRAVRILTWFSHGYYSVDPLPGGAFQFNDLRFGEIERSADDRKNYIFKFVLEPKDGRLQAYQREASRRDMSGAFEYLWERAGGE